MEFLPFLKLAWPVVQAWWWLFLPFLLFPAFKFYWLWWRNDVFDEKNPRVLLEVRFPQIVEKPLRAMENVFAGLWQVYDPPNPREKWLEGQYQMSFSVEVISVEGQVRFFLRIPEGSRKVVEAAVYSQYPDAELTLADDYIKSVPKNIPNANWKIWGADYKMDKDDVYPLKTYPKFFEENPDTREEKRIDPMTVLVEGLSKLGEGEHLWLQFVLTPFSPADRDFVARGKKLVDKLVRRPEAAKPASVWHDVNTVGATLITGNPPKEAEAKQQELIPPEMKLTPGERDVVTAVEQKISKPSFSTTLRFIYIAKSDKYFGPAKALPMSYFNQFSTSNLNFLRPLQTVKVHTMLLFFLDQRRGYLRRRRILRNYITRVNPFFPASGGTFVMNIEEMASMFHFPSRLTFPSATVPRVEERKGEAPHDLPTE